MATGLNCSRLLVWATMLGLFTVSCAPALHVDSGTVGTPQAVFKEWAVQFQVGRMAWTFGAATLEAEFVGAGTVSPHKTAPGFMRYNQLWPGVDAEFVVQETHVKSTYFVAPHANPRHIKLRYNTPVRILRDGTLQFVTSSGTATESAPVAWQERNGQRQYVSVRFAQRSHNEIGFEVDEYDTMRELVIDPTFEWHTFYGSAGNDIGVGSAVDSDGNIFVTGRSNATWNGPNGEAPLHAFSGGEDIFITKLDKEGNYLWHTFYGGPNIDWGWIIVPVGNVVYTMFESRSNWLGANNTAPLKPFTGTDSRDNGVLKLSTQGGYIWHTFYGSDQRDIAWGMYANANDVYVCGRSTKTWNGPNGEAPKHAHTGETPAGNEDLYLLKLNSAGSYVWHTFFGVAEKKDQCSDVELDKNGNVFVSGRSDGSWNGPSGQQPLNAHTNTPDALLMRLNANGNYVWHTFYGSSTEGEEGALDIGYDVLSDSMFMIGNAEGEFNGPGGVPPLNPYTGGKDVFLMKLTLQGGYLWHTIYGSPQNDFGNGSLVGADGSIYVSITAGGAWNGPGGIAPIGTFIGNPYDAGFLKLSPSGAYQWHAFFGASGDDQGYGMTLHTDGKSRLISTGYSNGSWKGPDGQAPLHDYTGTSGQDFFVFKVLDETPVSVQFGQPQVTVNENAGVASIPVVLSSASVQTITVAYSTTNGTAIAGSDYTAQAGTITFAPKQTTGIININVPIQNDNVDEADEFFSVRVANPVDASIGAPGNISVTIGDDDVPMIVLTPAQLSFSAASGDANPSPQSFAISGVTDWTAVAGAPWLVIDTAAGSGPGNVGVSVNIAGKAVGVYNGVITITAPSAPNSPQSVAVQLVIGSGASGDAFESDDTCAQARAIATNGTLQTHTFHTSTDTDWMSFNAVSGTTYIIQAQIPPGSPADATLELHSACGAFPQTQNFAFSPGVRQEYQATQGGPIFLHWSNADNTQAGMHVAYNVTVNEKANTPQLGAVIIVAGRDKLNDSLQTNIHNVTNAVYRMFLEKGYSADRIQYLATDLTLPGVDGLPTTSNLSTTITSWSKQWLADGRSLTLYLMDHGEEDLFLLDDSRGERLVPQQLNDWLNEIESQYNNLKVNVLIDACFSGSFIALPGSISKPGRVVLASTQPASLAFASDTGAVFSDHLVPALNKGLSVFDAFLRTSWATNASHGQVAQIDDNGDGIANTISDGAVAQLRGFSFFGTFNSDVNWPPFIQSATTLPTANASTRSLQAKILDNSSVSIAHAVIYEPGYTPPPAQSRLVTETLPTITLINQGNNNFAAEWPGFTKMGLYRIVIHAKDDKGEPAQPLEIFFFNGRRVFAPVVMR